MNFESKQSDNVLLVLLSNGDQKAFEEIYTRYASMLFGLARKSMASREEAEEIVQEIFESLWVRREKLNHVAALAPYLVQMVRYKTIRHLQRLKTRQKYAEHYRLFEATLAYQPEEIEPNTPVLQRLQAAINSLPPRPRQALNLRLNQNLSNEEIASAMNVSKRTVENYFVTIYNHLKSQPILTNLP